MTQHYKFYGFILFCFACVLSGQVTLAAEKPQILLEISKEGSFEVLYDRATSTATGAVLFGLVGAAIEEGVDQSNDKAKENQVLPHLDSPSCSTALLVAMQDTFSKDASYELVLPAGDAGDTTIPLALKITINSCGFRIVNSTNKTVSAYADVKMELSQRDVKEPVEEEKILVHGGQRVSFTELISQPELINSEFTSVLQKAGKRVANKVIFHSQGQ